MTAGYYPNPQTLGVGSPGSDMTVKKTVVVPFDLGETGECTVLYGLSYNSPCKPPHNKRILDEEEERNRPRRQDLIV